MGHAAAVTTSFPIRWWSAYVVGAAFVFVVCVVKGAFVVDAEPLCALGAAVVVPLALAAGARDVVDDGPQRLRPLTWIAVPLGGMCGLASLCLAPGPWATALATAWLAATSTMALAAVARILRRGFRPLSEFAIDVGHVYVVVGAIWLVANRSAQPLLGFQEPVVLYTATHFHFAGCAAPVVAGLALRAWDKGFVRASTLIVIGGIPLVAAGITFTRALELPAALVLATGMFGLMVALVVTGVRRVQQRDVSGLLLIGSGLSLVLSMSLVVVFVSTGSVMKDATTPLIPYATMVRLHGTTNAVGFSLLALIAFVWRPPARGHGVLGGSFPDVFFGGFVGVDVFDRNGRVDAARGVVDGQLGALEEFGHDGFDAARVDARVRAFYEQTSKYELLVTPTWHLPFAVVAPVVVAVARRVVGNCVLPLQAEREETVRTRLFGVVDDGRKDVRGYVRSVDGVANFVAGYATHSNRGRTWLSVGLPLPWSWLVAVLRFENVGADGLAVTSWPGDAGVSDEGMFFVCRFGVVRLPLNERIAVFVDEDGGVGALHVTRCFGMRVCTLRYRLVTTST